MNGMKFKKINLSKLFYNENNASRGTLGDGESCRDSCRCGSCSSCDGRQSASPRNSGNGDTESAPSCRSRDPYGNGTEIRDKGNEPIVFDIRKEAFMTPDFRTALWTGGNLQLTVMTIPVGDEIGVEMHESLDQLIGVVSGAGEVSFGNRENYLAPPLPLDAHSVVLVPAGTYHNVVNVGKTPLKLYSVYAPRAHKFGTVEKNKV